MDIVKQKYWLGKRNTAIRMYFYCQRGLALFNELRYLFFVIFGLYVLLKLTNPAWMVLMFIISLPILILTGWIQTHKMAKTMDWLTTEYASYWSRYGFELQERQTFACEDILKNIEIVRKSDDSKTTKQEKP